MQIFPENVSTYGQKIDDLFWLTSVFVIIAFVVSLFVLLYPLVRYGHKRSPKAEYITGEKRKHMKWVMIALVLLLGSDFIILYSEHDAWQEIENVPAKADVHVGVTARQWNFVFTYPGPDGILGTADDVVIDELNSSLHVPINKNVVFELRSQDVIHGFFLANGRFKQDVVPGRAILRWFNITKEGQYDISCTQICGILHSRMRNFVLAESEEKYKHFTDSLYNANGHKTATINK
ncbi:MAG: cytochrome c oxidase subunit II [Bacteroidia bacterium]